jgi:hypothetical protein
MITFRHAALLTTLITLSSPAIAQDGKKGPLTQNQALKLGPEKLTAYTNESEAGQDQAAFLYATAKQIQTEQALALKDLEQVVTLREWRDAITKCRQGAFSLAYIYNGGGTMYSHAGARDGAMVEDFLADFAKSLPLPQGKGSAKVVKKIDDNIAFIKTLNLADAGIDADKEAKAKLSAEASEVIQHWESLKYLIQEIPAAEAMKVVVFATGSLDWLKN